MPLPSHPFHPRLPPLPLGLPVPASPNFFLSLPSALPPPCPCTAFKSARCFPPSSLRAQQLAHLAAPARRGAVRWVGLASWISREALPSWFCVLRVSW
ncbi:hypothetical protein SETIT_4G203300v2 [Setaria italica]|uniref:Uncharacterized protein n=1 Tax=Setaria italica TaxID=4555 RepID=A0A368QW79_SETIT|nr:hypothetical protein SETIT_4G203300v2 [Setaria italica]